MQLRHDSKKVLIVAMICYCGFSDFYQLSNYFATGAVIFFQHYEMAETFEEAGGLDRLEEQQMSLDSVTAAMADPAKAQTFEEAFRKIKRENWSMEKICESYFMTGLRTSDAENECSEESIRLYKQMAENSGLHVAELFVKMMKEVMVPTNRDKIAHKIAKKKAETQANFEALKKSQERVNHILMVGGLGLLVHVLVLFWLGYTLLSEEYSTWKKFGIYWATIIFYWNFDVKTLSLRGSTGDFIILKLLALGIFTLGTSYLFPTNNKSKQIKKLKTQKGPFQFHQFCAQGQLDKLKELIRKNRQSIDINALDKNGNTSLHLAVSCGQLKVVTLIASEFEDEVDTSPRNSEGYDALELAITKNSVKPSMIVHQVLKISRQASLSSLSLALKTNQDNLIGTLISKIPDSLFAPDPSLKETLKTFQKLLSESKRKNVKKEESIKANLEIQRGLIIDRLEALQSDKPETWKKEYSCPICFEDMKPPLQIFACVQDHFICSECLKLNAEFCPICRDNFRENPPTRRPLAEKWNA